MQKNIKHRLISLLSLLSIVSCGVYLILYNLNDNITFFYTPTKLTKELEGRVIRIGGLVEVGSIKNISVGKIQFVIEDLQGSKIKVYFQGVPPVLFKENQGIVAKGKLKDGIFIADALLAKHDENYRPPEE